MDHILAHHPNPLKFHLTPHIMNPYDFYGKPHIILLDNHHNNKYMDKHESYNKIDFLPNFLYDLSVMYHVHLYILDINFDYMYYIQKID